MREHPAFLASMVMRVGGATLLKREHWDAPCLSAASRFCIKPFRLVGIRVPAGGGVHGRARGVRRRYWTAPVVKGDNALELRFKLGAPGRLINREVADSGRPGD